MSTTAQALLADLPDTDLISLPSLRSRIGWDRQGQHNAVRQGLIRPVAEGAPGGGYQITRDDAVMLLVAAALALAAGVAVVIMLRAIQGAGLDAQVLARAMT